MPEIDMENVHGNYTIEFTNGDKRDVIVERNIINFHAVPLYLFAVDGTVYNWGNIISIKKVQ